MMHLLVTRLSMATGIAARSWLPIRALSLSSGPHSSLPLFRHSTRHPPAAGGGGGGGGSLVVVPSGLRAVATVAASNTSTVGRDVVVAMRLSSSSSLVSRTAVVSLALALDTARCSRSVVACSFVHTRSSHLFSQHSRASFHHPSSSASISTRNSLPSPSPSSSSSSFWHHASVFVRIAAAAYVVQVYVANFTFSIGPSMQPTLNDYGDVLFTESITPKLGRLRKGDIVTAVKPTDQRITILKRILAMPGDTVHVVSTKAIANNGTIMDSCSCDAHHGDRDDDNRDGFCHVDVVVPKGHVWLQGDNRSHSVDSRHYGAVPLALVKAKAWCRVWPITQITYFQSTFPPSSSTSSSSSS